MTVKRLDDSTLVGIVTLTGASHLNEPDLIEIKPLAMVVMLALTRRHKNHWSAPIEWSSMNVSA